MVITLIEIKINKVKKSFEFKNILDEFDLEEQLL